MVKTHCEQQTSSNLPQLSTKLWVYTNFDCNLRCSYCVAESHPKAPRRGINFETFKRIVDEALALGVDRIYLTGGEPFIRKDIYEMLAYSSDKLPTTILTNGMLFNDRRINRLIEIKNEALIIQISLDGSRPEFHDPIRGQGSWQKTVDGIQRLIDSGFRVRLSTTETHLNQDYLEEICEFRRAMGISDDDHIIRPLAKRGFSNDGMEVGKHNLVPEMTITDHGVFWHPLSTDPDLLVHADIFPLERAFAKMKTEFEEISASQAVEIEEFQ
jgi:MoaA/NifB/PqqE/SkfB family radical SAM enzyme